MKHIFLILIFLFSITYCQGQELIIKSVEVKSNDLSARTSQRLDLNGNPCALVKVRIALDNVQFSGSVIGGVDHSTSEYNVYMPEGTKRLTVLASGYLPLDVLFENFKIDKLSQSTVYYLTIETPYTKPIQQTDVYTDKSTDTLLNSALQCVSDFRLKDAYNIIQYIENKRDLSYENKRLLATVKIKIKEKISLGKQTIIQNIKNNKGHLDKAGKELLNELIIVASDDYWLNIIKNKQ